MEYTYGEFFELICKRASYFRKTGVEKRSKVAIYSEDDLDILVSMFALWGIGAIAIPMNVTLKDDNLRLIESIILPDFGFYAGTCN